MEDILLRIHSFVWGVPALLLILGVGIYLSIRTRFVQLRRFPDAVRAFLVSARSREDGSFQALCTALAATVGTGNIAGVAGAIAIGGPGSIFWMWLCAIVGMVTKMAEALLSVRFRHRDRDGNALGGPMYMIEQGMGKSWRPLAVCYCFFGVIAAFGVGNATQINAVTDSVRIAYRTAGREPSGILILAIGVLMAAGAVVSLMGGGKKVGKLAVMLVPSASIGYILLAVGALIAHSTALPGALHSIAKGAFSPAAVTGGAVGSAVVALRIGTARGVFTNEAGMGTAAIAHGGSEVKDPMNQGLLGCMEVFLDTIVICTLTALVVLTSGVNIPYGLDEGAALTIRAFVATYGNWVSVVMVFFMFIFAFATMLGWGLYGLHCARYLLGEEAWKPFVVIQAVTALGSIVLKTETVWILSDTVNGLMAIPNLICLSALSSEVIEICTDKKPDAAAGSVRGTVIRKESQKEEGKCTDLPSRRKFADQARYLPEEQYRR